MKIVTPKDVAFEKDESEIVVFLGGSCSDKKNWRNSVVKFLEKIEEDKVLSLDKLTLVNPFISKWSPDVDELQKQIAWESSMIEKSDIYSCYLDEDATNCISMFELGKALFMYKNKFTEYNMNYRFIVSAHPNFKFKTDLYYELLSSTEKWKCPVTSINIDKSLSSHASKILEAYIKFAK